MFQALLKILSLVLLVTASSNGPAVQQTPTDLIKNQGESAEIRCSHNIQGYDRIMWYKQAQNTELTFMGYHVGNSGNLEPNFRGKVKISGKANKLHSVLNVSSLSPDSAAVYFCAAYSTAVLVPTSQYKN
ncbi:hypothetical protein SRHO_G00137950 [Serrasalmus rhombeus]